MDVILSYIGIAILMALTASVLIHRRAVKAHQPSRPWSLRSLIGSLLILGGCTFGVIYYYEYYFDLFSEEPHPVATFLVYSALIAPLAAPWLFYVAYRMKHRSRP